MTPYHRKFALIKRILIVQLGLAFGFSLALLPFGRIVAVSALTGGGIYVLANTYAAWRSFAAPKGSNTAQGELVNLYRAELGKLIMILALFAAVFAGWKDVHIGAFISGCAVSMIAGAIVAAIQPLNNNPGSRGERLEAVE